MLTVNAKQRALTLLLAALAAVSLFHCASAIGDLRLEIPVQGIERGNGEFGVSGIAQGAVSIRAFLGDVEGGNEIFSRTVQPDERGRFSYVHQLTMREPSGRWLLLVSDENSTERLSLYVPPTRESSFLVVSFLSPSPTRYYRTSELTVSALVLDAGTPIKGATVYAWDISGKRQKLRDNGDGSYSLSMDIPYDAETGEFEILALAFARLEDGTLAGGQNSMKITVEKNPINVEFISPKTDEYAVGENLPIEIKLSYAGGKPVEGAKVYAFVNLLALDLAPKGGGIYAGTHFPKYAKNDVITLSVKAEDSAMNSGEALKSLKPGNYLIWQLKSNAIFYIFPALIIIYILYISLKEFRVFFSKSMLKRERQELLRLKVHLHEDFYRRNIIGERTFQQRNAEYNAKLDRIEAGLSQLKDA
ncbi:MAG: hypothetical protein V1676_06495 [Candidatus Diapherotrites archaeon]